MHERIVKNSRVLVTGGAGFIGSNLCERLLNQDNYLICLDNFSTGKHSNIERFLPNKRFRLITGDIRNIKTCETAVDGIDYIFHEAALGSVPRSINDPSTSVEVNIAGFVNMLFAAQKAKVKRFVYASSSSVYGDDPNLPKVEHSIGKPLSPYALTKLTDEFFARNFEEIYGIETVGLRYFNVFGPWQDPDGVYAAVIPRWILMMLRGESPVINGDGNNSRDFTYVENVVIANQLAATAKLSESESGFRVFNIGCGERTTLNTLYEILHNNLKLLLSGQNIPEAIHSVNREGDIPHSLANISKAKIELDYEPAVPIKEGLAFTCATFINLNKR